MKNMTLIIVLVFAFLNANCQKNQKTLEIDNETFTLKSVKVSPLPRAGYPDSLKSQELWYKKQKLNLGDNEGGCGQRIPTFVQKAYFLYLDNDSIVLVVECGGWSCMNGGIGDFGKTLFFLKTPQGYKRAIPSFTPME